MTRRDEVQVVTWAEFRGWVRRATLAFAIVFLSSSAGLYWNYDAGQDRSRERAQDACEARRDFRKETYDTFVAVIRASLVTPPSTERQRRVQREFVERTSRPLAVLKDAPKGCGEIE